MVYQASSQFSQLSFLQSTMHVRDDFGHNITVFGILFENDIQERRVGEECKDYINPPKAFICQMWLHNLFQQVFAFTQELDGA